MSISKKIVFFGTDSFSVSALRHLIEAGYTIEAVVSKPDSRSGRGQKQVAPAVKILALEHDITVWQPQNVKEIADDISELGENTIAVLSSFGRIIPQSIINLFSPGILDIHPSLLPLYRGPSPIEMAIINGDEKTGVSLMLLTAEMDAGPVYDQIAYPLDGSETQSSLYTTLADLGSELLLKHLPAIANGTLSPTEQKSEPTYSRLLQKADAVVDPKNDTAEYIARHVRAYELFPKTKLELYGHVVTITRVHVGANETDALIVPCFESELVIDEIVAPSGRRISGADFLRGYAR